MSTQTTKVIYDGETIGLLRADWAEASDIVMAQPWTDGRPPANEEEWEPLGPGLQVAHYGHDKFRAIRELADDFCREDTNPDLLDWEEVRS